MADQTPGMEPFCFRCRRRGCIHPYPRKHVTIETIHLNKGQLPTDLGTSIHMFNPILYILMFFMAADHDFKMSVCEIVYQPELSNFEIQLYIFQDDLKETIYGNPEAERLESHPVAEYINKHLSAENDEAKKLGFGK